MSIIIRPIIKASPAKRRLKSTAGKWIVPVICIYITCFPACQTPSLPTSITSGILFPDTSALHISNCIATSMTSVILGVVTYYIQHWRGTITTFLSSYEKSTEVNTIIYEK